MVRTWLLFLLIGTGSLPAEADETGLGRLFTTPAERAHLDAMRANGGDPLQPAEPNRGGPEARGGARYSISGLVRRAGGGGLAWINGSVVPSRATQEGATVLIDGANSVSLLLPGDETPIGVKPGQALDAATGQVRETYARPDPMEGGFDRNGETE